MDTLDSLFDEAKRRVLARPNDLPARRALWQVLAARGELDRAHKQLDAMVAIDSDWSMEALSCQALLRAEAQRTRMFVGEEAPVCLGEPPEWFGDLVAGLKASCDAQGAPAAAVLLHRAQQAAAPSGGSINGQGFEWLCDSDGRLGPCFELIVKGQYLWAPWSRLTRLQSRPPTEIRDRIWLHAMLEFGDEGTVEGFLPARYPNPQNDDQRLGRVTECVPIDG